MYTKEGYRVIALGTKSLPDVKNYRKVQNLERKEVESDLVFLGLIVMENKLKDATAEVIRTLQQCNVRTIMATGDNVLTAVSVAK
jgi:P-type E1-E2 ATPase